MDLNTVHPEAKRENRCHPEPQGENSCHPEAQRGIDGWYVIFLDKKKRFRCWHQLENFCEIDDIANDIAGFAKNIKAKHIIMARLDDGREASVGHLDICWIAALLKYCEQKHIKLDDYLVITEKGWCSYTDDCIVE